VKTRYKYIHFVQVYTPPERKTTIWNCCHTRSGVVLGQVRWYRRWRRYCYFPLVHAVYSAECLRDIDEFIGQVAKEPPAPEEHLTQKG
jgi:hypothetical protein